MNVQYKRIYAEVSRLLDERQPVVQAIGNVGKSLGLSPGLVQHYYYRERRQRLERGDAVPTTTPHRPTIDPTTRHGQAVIYERFDPLELSDAYSELVYQEALDRGWLELSRSLRLDFASVKQAYFDEKNRRMSLTPEQASGLTSLDFDLNRPIFHVEDDGAQHIADSTSAWDLVFTYDGHMFVVDIAKRHVVTPVVSENVTTTPRTDKGFLTTGQISSAEPELEWTSQGAPSFRIYWQADPTVALLQLTPDLPKSLQPLSLLTVREKDAVENHAVAEDDAA